MFGIKNPFKKKYEIVELKDFSCEGMNGFTFKHPVFKGWEIKRIKKTDVDKCTINLKWPGSLGSSFVTPHVEVKQDMEIKMKISDKTPKNPQGVYYLGPSNRNINFISPELLVNINLFGTGNEDNGFSEKEFWKAVIESFRIIKVTEDQATQIVLDEAKKQRPNAKPYIAQKYFQNNVWIVEVNWEDVLDAYMQIKINAGTGEIINVSNGSRA